MTTKAREIRDPRTYRVEHDVGELPPPEFAADYIPEDFASEAAELLRVTEPDLHAKGPRILDGRAKALRRTRERIANGKPILRRDLDRLPGGSLLAYADALEKIPHGAVSSLVAILLRQSAIMLAQNFLQSEGAL